MINYKLLDTDFLNNYNLKNEDIKQIQCEIIFSLTSIPTRFIHKKFEKTIESLYNQFYKPKYIIINLCNNYKRNFEYDKNIFEEKIKYYKEKFDNVIINICEDYGPITKILGLYKRNDLLKSEDKIIVVDDDRIYKPYVSYYYNLVYQLYNCDCVFIDELELFSNKEINSIFYDNYKNFVYGHISFSFKYKFINQLYSFYNRVKTEDENIIYHDDLILTLFYKLHNLYACGINILFQYGLEVDSIINVDSLSSGDIKKPFRHDLEKNFCKKYGIRYYNRILSNHTCNLTINETILPRTLLYNISNINYDPNKNNFHFKQIDLKYFDKNIFILSLTYYNDNVLFEESDKQKKIYLQIGNENNYEEIEIELIPSYRSSKQSFFIEINQELKKIYHKNYSFNIFQLSSKNNNLHINKFYSINSILSYIPDIKYEFFDNIRQLEYLYYKNKKLIIFINKLNPGTYKADLFRALYLYYESGLYIDCKNILYAPIYNLLSKEKSLCEDISGKIYTANLFFAKPFNLNLKNYILKILENIKYDLYTCCHLSVTAGYLLSNYINDDIYLKNSYDNDEWKNNLIEFNKSDKWQYSFVIEIKTNKIIFKTSYYNYYSTETERIDYVDLFNKKQIYSPISITEDINTILD